MNDTWTPPQMVGIIQKPEDTTLFSRLGLDIADSQPHGMWALTRGKSDAMPLKLFRPDGVALCVDFNSGKARHRTTENGKGAQALAKALGVKQFYKTSGEYPAIIDATGGLGQDSWALASLGCTLHVIESHPVVHALLADGLSRALLDENTVDIAARVSLTHHDAVDQLSTLTGSIDTHAIYLDPMYPARRKRASSKKGMQFLHRLLKPCKDTQKPDLLLSALACRVARVAVKRPKGAGLLAGTDRFVGQRTVIDTPNTRYDVYHLTSSRQDITNASPGYLDS